MNDEKALKWIRTRISFIEEHCNLEDETNRNALDVLLYIERKLIKKDVN